MERVERAHGHIVCSLEANRIVVTYEGYPFVHAFTPDGQVAWEAVLDPFIPMKIERISVQGLPGIHVDRDRPNDMVLRAVALPGGAVLVQVARLTGKLRDERGYAFRRIERTDSYVFSAATGQSVYVSSNVPPLIFATDHLLIGLREDPQTTAPEVVGYEF
jgi:hypothetical protein